MKPLQNKKTLLVTTGDSDGVGFEVTAKALVSLPKVFFKTSEVCVFVTKNFEKKYFTLLCKSFRVVTLHLSSSAFSLDALVAQTASKKPCLYFVVCSDSPPAWIFSLAGLCLNSPSSLALITAPLSKTLIKAAGYSEIGHTEILATVSKSNSLYMAFVGMYFNVVLLTGHIPLKAASDAFKKIQWDTIRQLIDDFIPGLRWPKKPVGVLGVNPHAGEKGLITGGEEAMVTSQIEKINKSQSKTKWEGPLVPDAAFLKANWSRYSVYLCGYHDQGLIPFKAIHGQDSGVHVTLGLPFIRTSVDHGTAKEIFGKNRANPNSMIEALLLAKKLLNKKLNV